MIDINEILLGGYEYLGRMSIVQLVQIRSELQMRLTNSEFDDYALTIVDDVIHEKIACCW